FQGAYREWDNGRGYNFEYRIPWDTLGADDPPGAGDIVAGTANVLWARPDGLATGGGQSWAYDIMREPGFPWQSASVWGKLIFRDQGNVPRELVTEGIPPERPRPLEFPYELPDDGHATIQLFAADGEISRIIVPNQQRPGGVNAERWDGMDNHGEVDDHGGLLPAGEYQWRGLFSEEGLELKYRFSVHNSGNPPYRTPDQTGGWGGDHGDPQTVTAHEQMMFISWSASEAGWGVIRTDLDGQKKWGSDRNARYMTTDGQRLYRSNGGPVEMLDVELPRPVGLPNGSRMLAPPEGGDDETNRVTGLAYHEGTVYVAYGPRDLVGVYDADDGSLRAAWDVPEPGRMAIRPDGSAAVISGDHVVSVTDGRIETWLDDHLDEPVGIAIADDGTTCVANQGALQNVSVFDAEGAYTHSIGRTGGRPAMGAYDREGMYMPGGITLDARGRLWVAETADYPKRVSVWNVSTGENVEEFFGASSYFAYGYIDPARPDEIYAHNVLWRIDWDDYTTEPGTTIWRATEPNMVPPPNHDAHSSGGGFRMVTTEAGRQIGWGGAGRSRNPVLYIREGEIFRPFAGVINPWRDAQRFPALADYKNEREKAWEEQRLARHRRPHDLFWQDANGDGKVSVDEITPLDNVGKPITVHPDMSVLLGSGHLLRPAEVTDDGRPVYDIAQAEHTPWVEQELFGGFMMQGPQRAVYTLRHREGPSLIKWNSDGEMAWYYADLIRWRGALGLPTVGPGRLWGMTRPMGVAGDYIAFQTYFGPNQIFRRDGLYVGALINAGGAAEEPYSGQNEGQGGAFVKLDIDGEERYFLIHGSHDVRVWEVLGLDTLEELPGGTYTHTDEHVQQARRAYTQYLADMEGETALRIVRGRDALDDAPAASKQLDNGLGFEARLAYDQQNLYVRYDVQSPHGLVNTIPDPQRAFLGGNCLDLQLATDPDADAERETPAPGDVRLVVTRQEGKPLAVLYQPRVEGVEGEGVRFESPTGEERFDRIELIETVTLDYEAESDRFTATVTVPLDTLGLELRTGDRLKLDVGYVFGNPKGSEAVQRAYLYNDGFSANVIDDLPNESRLVPHEWGVVTVD
ncbi:MAG: hypothetical protein ACODAQ_00240, partial [Phycisphaeraceae bacterium]